MKVIRITDRPDKNLMFREFKNEGGLLTEYNANCNEVLSGLPPPTEYFVNPTGTNTAPYDTAAKGATSISELIVDDGINPADNEIVNIVGDNGDIDETQTGIVYISCTVRKDPASTNKPVVNMNYNQAFRSVTGRAAFVWENIIFIKDVDEGVPSAGGMLEAWLDMTDPTSIIFDANEFRWVGSQVDSPGEGIIVNGEYGEVVTIKNNIFHYLGRGITIQGRSGKIDNPKIYFNTFYNCAKHRSGIHVIDVENANGIDIKNNIIYSTPGSHSNIGIRVYNSTGTLTADYNDVYGVDTLYNTITPGVNSLNVDPLLTDPANYDYSLGALSACRNAGTDVSIVVDKDDAVRPQDGGYDMGAVENAHIATTYFVNPDGSATSPYDTAEKGATTITALVGAVTLYDDDIIELVEAEDPIDESLSSPITIGVSVTIRSWASNEGKPTIKCPNDDKMFIVSSDADSPKFHDIKMYKAGPSASGFFIDRMSATDAPEVVGCEFWVEDTSILNDAGGIFIEDATFSTGCKIEDNLFYDLRDAMYSEGGGSTVQNVSIKNNRFYRCSSGLRLSDNAAVNFDVCNNSFNDVVNPIKFGSNLTTSNILNNAMDGQGSIGTGVYVQNYVSGSMDRNVIHDFDTDVTIVSGAVTDLNTDNSDPLFVSITDLHLQNGSPCIDQGVGNGTNDAVPTVDADGTERPIDQTGVENADDGTDIGAYEEEYIEKTVSVPSEISTISEALDTGDLNPGDTLEIDGDAGEIDDSVATGKTLPAGVTMKRKPGTARPRVKINASDSLFDMLAGSKVEGIDFYKEGGSSSGYFIGVLSGDGGGHSVEDCSFEADVGSTAEGFKINDETFTSVVQIAKNIFKNLKRAIRSFGAPLTLQNVVISNNRYIGCEKGIFVEQNAIDVHVVNNSFSGCDIGIDFDSDLTTSNILNNAMDCDGGTAGVQVQNYVSGVIDYNVIHGYTTDIDIIGGAVAAGPENSTDDPLFTSESDLTLQVGSPCLDAGIRTGYTSIIPTIDAAGVSRPVDQPLKENVDDGTDIGAFEMPLLTDPTSIMQRPLDIITVYNKIDRVTRSIVDIDNFQMSPGMWGIITDDGKIDMISDYTSPLCKMLINYVSSGFYETHDTKASRVTTVESFGTRFRISNAVYVGNPAADELLTVSAEAGEEGQLRRIVSLAEGNYYAFARVTKANAEQGWIECITISPIRVQVGGAPPGASSVPGAGHYSRIRRMATGGVFVPSP